jgi:hypothetical protein
MSIACCQLSGIVAGDYTIVYISYLVVENLGVVVAS